VHLRFPAADFILQVVVERLGPLDRAFRFLSGEAEVEVGKSCVVGEAVEALGLEDDAWMEGNERERRSGFCQKRDRGRKS